MRTSLLVLVPSALFGGLLYGGFLLYGLAPQQTPCEIGGCPAEIHKSDSGQTFIYAVGGRFDVSLTEKKDPKDNLQCVPDGVVRLQGYTPSGLRYTASFEAVSPGTCILSSDDFFATIVIQGAQ